MSVTNSNADQLSLLENETKHRGSYFDSSMNKYLDLPPSNSNVNHLSLLEHSMNTFLSIKDDTGVQEITASSIEIKKEDNTPLIANTEASSSEKEDTEEDLIRIQRLCGVETVKTGHKLLFASGKIVAKNILREHI